MLLVGHNSAITQTPSARHGVSRALTRNEELAVYAKILRIKGEIKESQPEFALLQQICWGEITPYTVNTSTKIRHLLHVAIHRSMSHIVLFTLMFNYFNVGKEWLFRYLLQNLEGLDIDLSDCQGRTLLHYACSASWVPIVG